MRVPDAFILQLNLLAIVVLLTILFSLLFKKNNAKSNYLLSLLVLYPALSIILNVVFIIFREHNFLFLAPVNTAINLTFGPVLLCYLYLLQGKSMGAIIKNVWHFVPSFIVFLCVPYYILIPEKEKLSSLNSLLAGEEQFINILNLAILIHICFYLYKAWKIIAVYKEKSADLGIPETEVSVQWQQAFLKCIITVNLLLLFAFALPILITGKAHIYSDLIATPAVAIVLYIFMIYKGLSYHVIFSKPEYHAFLTAATPLNHFIEEEEKLKISNRYPKYHEDFNNEISLKLERLFVDEKIHTKPGLKLHNVATALNISPAVLSNVINTSLKMTFFELVNYYRTEEAKKMLIHPDYQHYKIEYIGEISGFNSRASFFSVFKKTLGKTPQAFKDEYFLKENSAPINL